MTAPQAFLHSKHLYLRHLLEEDANGPYLAWFNDDQVCYGNSHHVFPFTREAAVAYIRESLTNRSDLVLAIIDAGSGTHIGNIALQQIHPVYHSAEFAIVIGDKSFWSKGYGLEAGKLICGHGFSRLNLHRIYCNTFDNNTAMKKLALSLGMAEEGRRKEAAYTHGSYLDVIEYGMTREDYVSFWKGEKKGD